MEEVSEDNTVKELLCFSIPTPSKSLTEVMDSTSSYQSNYFSWSIKVFIKTSKPLQLTVNLHALHHSCFVLLPA